MEWKDIFRFALVFFKRQIKSIHSQTKSQLTSPFAQLQIQFLICELSVASIQIRHLFLWDDSERRLAYKIISEHLFYAVSMFHLKFHGPLCPYFPWPPWKLSAFQNNPTLCPSTCKLFLLPWPWKSNFKWTQPPPSPTNYGITTAPCMGTNEIKTKTKPSYVTFKLTTRLIVRFNPQTMQWYH